ncbi:hypothetical protein RhiirA1_471248 [Rhizophagus irregularis]|uniref:Uncharacterized protein n=1 Tax=Rhizophagus irregularis TaxID=588596 RepID=A0A2N0R4P0_9GLOM|nr:hypothetical protein RhiirA1_471248 [Rhizophagus irregularis]
MSLSFRMLLTWAALDMFRLLALGLWIYRYRFSYSLGFGLASAYSDSWMVARRIIRPELWNLGKKRVAGLLDEPRLEIVSLGIF